MGEIRFGRNEKYGPFEDWFLFDICFPPEKGHGEKKEGCFVATAVYGSAFAPQVEMFRILRDTRLMPHSLGRALVRVYYSISPEIAVVLVKKPRLLKMTRWFLDAILVVMRQMVRCK